MSKAESIYLDAAESGFDATRQYGVAQAESRKKGEYQRACPYPWAWHCGKCVRAGARPIRQPATQLCDAAVVGLIRGCPTALEFFLQMLQAHTGRFGRRQLEALDPAQRAVRQTYLRGFAIGGEGLEHRS